MNPSCDRCGKPLTEDCSCYGDPTRVDVRTDPLTQRMSGRTFWGNLYFDVPYISHILDNLYTGGCEEGMVLPRNIEHVVSLYPWEQYEIEHEVKSVLLFRAYDDNVPEELIEGVVQWAGRCVQDGPTLIHCQAGLNRSALIAVQVLRRFVDHTFTVDGAIQWMREKRSPAILCNPKFVEWLHANS